MSEQENTEALAIMKESELGVLGWGSISRLSVMAVSKAHVKGMACSLVREFTTVGDVFAYL